MPRCGRRLPWAPAVLLFVVGAASAEAVLLSGDAVTARQGATTVAIGVALDGEDDAVAGVQNDLTVSPPLRFQRRANGRPDCAVNPAINKGGTSFAFQQPTGCDSGECETLRALVLALDNVDAIADPVELYICRLLIEEPLNGTYPVRLSHPGASDPDGNALAVETVDGSVTVGVGEGALIAIGDSGACGPAGAVDVSYLFGPSLDALSHVIAFDPAVPIAADEAGLPRCVPRAPLDADHATFAFLPQGCTPGTDCQAVRVWLRAELGAAAIESGAVLYTCEVAATAAAAVGVYALPCSDAAASSAGIPDLVAVCRDGSFRVGGCEHTPTPTDISVPSATPTGAVASPPSADGDGCAITPGTPAGLWPLAAALALWSAARQRRSR